jgi:hypothetical protein
MVVIVFYTSSGAHYLHEQDRYIAQLQGRQRLEGQRVQRESGTSTVEAFVIYHDFDRKAVWRAQLQS